MKRFLSQLTLFCFFVMIICFLLDVFISSRIKHFPDIAKGEYSVWNDIYGGKINSDLVINGSSRAWVHIDPTLLTNALNISSYNLGIDGQSFPLQYFRYKELLRFNKRPKIIIHSVDFSTFNRAKELYNYDQFLPYMLFDRHIWNATRHYVGFNIWDFIIPGLRYYGEKKIIEESFKSHNENDFIQQRRIRGYLGRNRVWNNDLDDAKKNLRSYTAMIDSNVVMDFVKYLEECKENNTKIILVFTPLYVEGQKFVQNREEVVQIFKNLSSKFHIHFLNYLNDSISYQKKYFYNASHLNTAGSQLFTKVLIADIKKDTSIRFSFHEPIAK